MNNLETNLSTTIISSVDEITPSPILQNCSTEESNFTANNCTTEMFTTNVSDDTKELSDADDADDSEDFNDSPILDNNIMNNLFNLTDNSELYVISIDNIPKFYVNTLEVVQKKMTDIFQSLVFNYVHNENYMLYLHNMNFKNEIHIIRKHKFFIISYDEVIHRIRYNIIKECT